jgi:hypothetical protein
LSEDETFALDPDGHTVVVARFHNWVRDRQIEKPNGRHVVRFCADMWVARTFPGDLGIPAVWGILETAGAFTSRRKPSR